MKNVFFFSTFFELRHPNQVSPKLDILNQLQNSTQHIQEYSGIFRTMFKPGIFRILAYREPDAYSEPWHFDNPRHIQNPVKLFLWSPLQIYLAVIIFANHSYFYLLYFLSVCLVCLSIYNKFKYCGNIYNNLSHGQQQKDSPGSINIRR